METWLSKISKNTKIFHSNIEKDTIDNKSYRKVLFTTSNSQLVLMSLKPGEEIGTETHGVDQFFRFESGSGQVIVGQATYDVTNGSAVIIPGGTKHNIKNTGKVPLKLYSIYSPPNHKKGTEHKTKSDATEEHFDGLTDA